jgi:SAM-dependent methyltransferase
MQNPEINVEALMERIREEVAWRKQVGSSAPASIAPARLPRMIENEDPVAPKDSYAVEELLDYDDEDFVRNAYRAIFRREPDREGCLYYLNLLRQGTIGKKQLIELFLRSPEGEALAVKVHGLTPLKLPCLAQSAGLIEIREDYGLADFLNYHDEDFVRNAYRGILRREPDSDGWWRYLIALRQGELSKIEIIACLRYSPEAKLIGVSIRGLRLRSSMRRAFRLPVVGYLLSWANYLLRLPTVVRSFERYEGYFAAVEVALNEKVASDQQILSHAARSRRLTVQHINAVSSAAENALNQAATADSQIRYQIHFLVKQLAVFKADAAELAATVTRLGEELAQKAGVAQVEALAAQTGEKIFSLTQALKTKADNERLTQLTNHLVDLVQHKADAAELAATATRLGEELAQKAGVAQVGVLAAQSEKRLAGLTQALETKADAATTQRDTREIQRQILDQQRRLALLLEEARKRLPKPMSTEQIENMVAEEDHLLDAFYVSFEDRFRGPREEIKQRVAIYLPIVKEVKAGTKKAPILDIGCGRGEWLELLQENDLVARGVDLNRVMVSQCQELKLEVAEADAIAYLRGLKANSLGAVTGIHIIEHIPFKRLVALFDEVLRVLKPGGVAIFETPNPENLIVGACNFYYDPTHLNPLPPEPMRFVMEARGFGRIEIMRLHPQPESAMLREGPVQVQQIVNGLMFGAQDYALVGYKA